MIKGVSYVEANEMKKRQKIRKGIILVSFFLFPAIFYYLSPVLIIQASSAGIVNGSFVLFSLLFLSALFFGRGYCGWLCPGAGCQEALFLARDQEISKGDVVKWLIWVPWMSSIVFFAVKAGGYKDVDFFYQTTYGFSIANIQSVISYYCVLFLLIVFPALIFGKRAFCHYLCWMAPFMILGRKLRNTGGWHSLQLRSNPDQCIHCHTCSQNCPMSLPVEKMVSRQSMENKECIFCGTCVDGCEQGAIHFSF